MGKLRERRRQERKRRQIRQACIGIGLFLAICLLGTIIIKALPDREASGTLAGNTQGDMVQNGTGEGKESEQGTADSMQIVMIGDMLMHEKILKSGKLDTGGYNFDHLFTNVKDFVAAADLAIVNQETIIGGSAFGYTGYPSFNTPSELVDAEVKAGFDVLLFATNHAYDKGAKGVRNCMEYLESTHPDLGYVGINQSAEDRENIYTYEANGITVAILNYTYGHNGVKLPKDLKYLINELDEEKIRSDIRKAEEIADFTIVCPHWGTEFKHTIDAKQEAWTNIFLEEGVDLVLGTHPHVVEPVEWVTHENGHKMLVYYSLGNFINGTDSSGHGVTDRMIGAMADILLERNAETGNVEIKQYDAHPVVCHIAEKTEYTVYFLKDYTEELAKQNLALQQDSEFSKSLCESIFYQVFGE